MTAPHGPTGDVGARDAIRVLLVDDSAVVRGMVARWIEETPDIRLAAIAVDGAQAVRKAEDVDAEVCVLDIEMPVMTGLEALPRLLKLRPHLRVIMASTLSERGAAVTLQALDAGAVDYIAKPSANRLGGAEAYRTELIAKIRTLGRRPLRSLRPAPLPPAARAPGAPRSSPRPDALVIASSTGGPPALRQLLGALGDRWAPPVLIAQHMPAAFTKSLAQMLAKVSPLEVREAVDGEAVRPGVVYIAPGDHHLTVRTGAAGHVLTRLDQSAAVNWCRPSADPLFASAAEVWGPRALGLVLTGMGHDGREGARALVARGARILAQDEATSVVWGMPGAVVEAGLADRVLPLGEIAAALAAIASGCAP